MPVVHELHHSLGEGEALFRVVGDAELYEEIGEAHDPEPYSAVPPAHLVDLGKRVVILLDDVVQKRIAVCTVSLRSSQPTSPVSSR